MEVMCPFCGKNNVSFKLSGYPSQGMEALAQSGKFILSGCVPSGKNWYCNECNKSFRDTSKFPCGFCSKCNTFLASKHVSIRNDGDNIIRSCIKCRSILL